MLLFVFLLMVLLEGGAQQAATVEVLVVPVGPEPGVVGRIFPDLVVREVLAVAVAVQMALLLLVALVVLVVAGADLAVLAVLAS
ncbi:MAG: hypothetical protein RQ757_06885 [Pseudomonadales bacterium]|nr:hypothetical protein [Pseudomonadales bacterium]